MCIFPISSLLVVCVAPVEIFRGEVAVSSLGRCEGLSLGIAENRLALIKAGYPVMPFEGNMGDEREFDLARTMARIDAFMESLGLKKLEE